MATLNPLEKKARSSFIKGLLIAGAVGLIGIGVLVYFLVDMKGDEKKRIAAQKDVIVLKQDVKSGEEITSDMFSVQKANAEVVSSELLTKSDFDTLSSEEDSEGNVATLKVYAKINIPAKSMLSADMVAVEGEELTDDQREQEYNMIVLPTTLVDGDTIDIRFRLPGGEDYTVISKKKVKLVDLGEGISPDTIVLKVTEDEIMTMSSVIVEAYQIEGSKLYATKFTSPGMQNAATGTYAPKGEILQSILNNPNIVETARNELYNRIATQYNNYRASINAQIEAVDERTRETSVQSGTADESATQRAERQTYLENMGGTEE